MRQARTSAKARATPPHRGLRLLQPCDLTEVTEQHLARWRAGRLEARQRAVTVERCRQAYAPLLERGARAIVTCAEANGGHPVLLLLPPGFEAARPCRVHTHFHGWNSTVAEPEGHPAGLTQAIARRFARDSRTLYVLPECANVPIHARPVWPGVQTVTVQTDWSNLRSICELTEQLLDSAGLVGVDVSERIVSAHSGGGRAFGYALQHRADGTGLVADRVELYDCLYSAPFGALSARQALKAWLRTEVGGRVKLVAYFEGDGGNGEKPDAEFLRLLGSRYFSAAGYTHNACLALNFGR